MHCLWALSGGMADQGTFRRTRAPVMKVLSASQDDVLPQPAGVSEVLAVQLTLLIRNLEQAQASAASFERAIIGDIWGSHVDKIGPVPNLSQSGIYALPQKGTYQSWTWSARCEIAPSGVRGASSRRYVS